MEELKEIRKVAKEEIEELKKDRYLYNAETGEITKVRSNCVSKDKIREIIDKYKYAKIPGMKQALEEIEKELLEEWLDE